MHNIFSENDPIPTTLTAEMVYFAIGLDLKYWLASSTNKIPIYNT